MTTEGTGNVALFNEDANGNQLAFYVTRVAARSQIIMLIQERGGEVLDRVVPADPELKIICIVNERLLTPITLPEGMIVVTRQFIIDCIEQNKLLPFERYAPNQGDVSVVLAPTTPQGRNAYTEEEDKALLDCVQQAIDDGYKIDGLKLYKLIAPQFPRHTFQSLKDRYLRQLLPRQQNRLFTSSSPLRRNVNPKSEPNTPTAPTTSPLKMTQGPMTDLPVTSQSSQFTLPFSIPLLTQTVKNEDCLTELPSTSASTAVDLSAQTTVSLTASEVHFKPFTQAAPPQTPKEVILIESDAPPNDPLTSPTLPAILSNGQSPTSSTEEIFTESQKKQIRSTVHWLTNTSGRPFEVVIFALYQFNGDVSKALAYLQQPTSAPWRCEEDLALLDGSDRSKLDRIIVSHGAESVKSRQAFLKAVCNNA